MDNCFVFLGTRQLRIPFTISWSVLCTCRMLSLAISGFSIFDLFLSVFSVYFEMYHNSSQVFLYRFEMEDHKCYQQMQFFLNSVQVLWASPTGRKTVLFLRYFRKKSLKEKKKMKLKTKIHWAWNYYQRWDTNCERC